MRTPSLVLVAAALWGACGRDPEPTAPTPTEPVSRSCKPEPPLVIELTSRVVGPERYELTVAVTATAAVEWMELAVAGGAGKGSYGPTARGQKRVVSTIVEHPDRSTEIWASARAPVEGVEMVKTTMITLGEPKPAPKTKLYATPDGELAREQR
jgi:hypothetical protein